MQIDDLEECMEAMFNMHWAKIVKPVPLNVLKRHKADRLVKNLCRTFYAIGYTDGGHNTMQVIEDDRARRRRGDQDEWK